MTGKEQSKLQAVSVGGEGKRGWWWGASCMEVESRGDAHGAELRWTDTTMTTTATVWLIPWWQQQQRYKLDHGYFNSNSNKNYTDYNLNNNSMTQTTATSRTATVWHRPQWPQQQQQQCDSNHSELSKNIKSLTQTTSTKIVAKTTTTTEWQRPQPWQWQDWLWSRCRSGWLVTYHRLMPSQLARLSQGDVEVDGDSTAVVDCSRNLSREYSEL